MFDQTTLRGFTQCHFFAGIGVWSYALRLAGWPDDRPVWTGSCPCQPFSAAGKGAGFADERHLWPAWHHLIRERDLQSSLVSRLQARTQTLGSTLFKLTWKPWVMPSGRVLSRLRASVLRTSETGLLRGRRRRSADGEKNVRTLEGSLREIARKGSPQDLSMAACLTGWPTPTARDHFPAHSPEYIAAKKEQGHGMANLNDLVQLASWPTPQTSDSTGGGQAKRAMGETRHGSNLNDFALLSVSNQPARLTVIWRDADWLLCRDEKWRPVEPGTFPLADGAPARVGRLRAYGNAINAQAAAEFIRAAREAIEQ
jgi:DNA (cytosine-5)-methyltransferase 1